MKDFFDALLPMLLLQEDKIQILEEYRELLPVTFASNNNVEFIKESESNAGFIDKLIGLYLEGISNGSIDYSDEEKESAFEALKKVHSFRLDENDILNVYEWGKATDDTLLIVLPVGTPPLIMEKWISLLMKDFRIICWETIGMFLPAVNSSTIDLTINRQLHDISRIIEKLNLTSFHVFGVCQGANLSLLIAEKFEKETQSVSLWHGDYHLEPEKLTFIQQNFYAMIKIAENQTDLSFYRHIMFNPKSLNKLLEEYSFQILPLILYPYTTLNSFNHFVKMIAEFIRIDIRTIAKKIVQDTLIVTSSKDITAHPSGSVEINQLIQKSELLLSDQGDHIHFFSAPDEYLLRFRSFIKNLKNA